MIASTLLGQDADRPLGGLAAEGSPDLLTVSTVDGFFLFVSSASRELFEWKTDDLLGQPEDAFVHPNDVANVEAARRQALRDTPAAVSTVYRFRCADGRYRWAEGLMRVLDGDGAATAASVHGLVEPLVVSSLRDVDVRIHGH